MTENNPCKELEEKLNKARLTEGEASVRANLPPSNQPIDRKIVPYTSEEV